MNFPFRRIDWRALAPACLLAGGCAAIYYRTFSVPLLWDDLGAVAENPTILHLWPIWHALSPPPGAGVGGRPLTNLSFAANYAIGGRNVTGYHLANLAIHVLASWTLYALVRRTLQRPVLAERFGPAASLLALTISALWSWHPVQTEAVTYLTQRSESLMALFYLLTLYSFVRWSESGPTFAKASAGRPRRLTPTPWPILTILFCLCGVGTKEVIVTAPLIVLLYDRAFISGSFASAFRRHGTQLAALAAMWIPLVFLLSGLRQRGAGFGLGVTWSTYALTQSAAVAHYLRLAFWPHPLIFDYGTKLAAGFGAVWPEALVTLLSLAATIFAGWKTPRAGFIGCWFFLILAPTSSFVPLAGQPVAEHRLYLPLAAPIALTVLGVYRWLGQRCLAGFALLALILGVAAAERNRDYRSDVAIWSDTAAKNPANPRAHHNLGHALLDLNSPGQIPAAIAEFQATLRLDPAYVRAHNDLGLGWSQLPGHREDAIREYEMAARLDPSFAEPHINLGNIWFSTEGCLPAAIAEYERALSLKPDSAAAHCNLGAAWFRTPGRMAEALAEFRRALRLDPDFALAHCNLALGLLNTNGDSGEARAHLEAALRAEPDNAEARRILNSIRPTRP